MHQLDDTNAIKRLESLLAAEREERARLQEELDLRNCALDSARTHFMIAGGAINVQCFLGSGTRFMLRLPLQGRSVARAA